MDLFSIKKRSQKRQDDASGLSLLLKQLVAVFLVVAVGICIGGYLYYDYQRSYVKKEVEQTLTIIADLKVRQITSWRN
jgi:hypothetical protein